MAQAEACGYILNRLGCEHRNQEVSEDLVDKTTGEVVERPFSVVKDLVGRAAGRLPDKWMLSWR